MAALVAGLAIAAAAQLSGPVVVRPLYDGVVVSEPYRWLDPPPGLKGGAAGVRNVVPARGGGISVATSETPPQAQVDPDYSALSLPPGTTSIAISIQPIKPPTVSPSGGVIAGNVYDLEVVNQRDEAVSVVAGQRVTMLFRGPSALPAARIERYAGGVWSAVETDPAGIPDMFTTLDDSFGVYALVAPPGWQPAGVRGSPTPLEPVLPDLPGARRRRRPDRFPNDCRAAHARDPGRLRGRRADGPPERRAGTRSPDPRRNQSHCAGAALLLRDGDFQGAAADARRRDPPIDAGFPDRSLPTSIAVAIDASFRAGTNLTGAAHMPGGVQSEPGWGWSGA